MRNLALRPSTWQLLSSLALVVFVAALVVDTDPIPQWGWIALLVSGVAFVVELVLRRRAGA